MLQSKMVQYHTYLKWHFLKSKTFAVLYNVNLNFIGFKSYTYV